MDSFSYISNAHPNYIESLYKDYKNDPASIDVEWKKFFEGFDFAIASHKQNGSSKTLSPKEFQVWQLIDAYRRRGHLLSTTNPIRPRKDRHPNLELENFGLAENDLKEEFYAGAALGLGKASLKNILDHLKQIYCRSLGFQYMYVNNKDEHKWLQEKIEKEAIDIRLPLELKKRILKKLNETAVFEEFLSKKYVGQKRFSMEGGESTIPALDTIINTAAEHGTEEVVIGMAHRGRLNVLANIMGKTYEHIFNEFEGNAVPDLTMGDGDVKYHLGYSSEITTPTGKKVNLKLAPNPSHLEAVTPVVQGYVRAKEDLLYNNDHRKALPLMIHGDAAIAGQGVVYEVVQMAALEGFRVGGSIHFVINNQIGFTTDFDDARSSHYSTSVAKTTNSPVIHVNGDDVEAVVWAVRLAAEYRQKFQKDIFIDMVCYRKHGHNEGDDPKYTQPGLYKLISKHKNPREIYREKLISSGDIEAEIAKKMDEEFWQLLQERLDMIKQKPLPYTYQEPELAWQQLRKSKPEDFECSPDTAITQNAIDTIVEGLIKVPGNFKPLRKVEKMLKSRRTMYFEEGKIDWAGGELLAYGSLLLEKHDIRMSGQDTKRGTFSHRHAMLYDEESDKEYNRLNNLAKEQGEFRIYNSLLSEFGVLGFEYGYSLASPNALTIWEAQFGDFSNGAQTIIDQFITSSETKWQRMSGIVLLLPHGYEGQGPEHSSARLERFLQACAEFNISVVNCTTPSNFFHLLRRQLKWPFRKPLVVMSPKSLLRHPKVISDISEFKKGSFNELFIDDFSRNKPDKVKKVLFCSGKIYYDLLERQEEEKRKDIVIVRLEQLYPLPFRQIDELIHKYSNAKIYWVQEEPANMGAWVYMLSCYKNVDWNVISRKSSASPATGYYKIHEKEQKQILDEAFA